MGTHGQALTINIIVAYKFLFQRVVHHKVNVVVARCGIKAANGDNRSNSTQSRKQSSPSVTAGRGWPTCSLLFLFLHVYQINAVVTYGIFC